MSDPQYISISMVRKQTRWFLHRSFVEKTNRHPLCWRCHHFFLQNESQPIPYTTSSSPLLLRTTSCPLVSLRPHSTTIWMERCTFSVSHHVAICFALYAERHSDWSSVSHHGLDSGYNSPSFILDSSACSNQMVATSNSLFHLLNVALYSFWVNLSFPDLRGTTHWISIHGFAASSFWRCMFRI